MSIQAVSWVLEKSQSRLGGRLVMLAIANHADASGENSWPSITTIAREAGLSSRQVQRILPELTAIGELKIVRNEGYRGTHLFTIIPMMSPVLPLGDDKLSGVTNRVKGGDNMSGGGDIYDKNMPEMSPEPSLEPRKKEEAKASSKESAHVGALALNDQKSNVSRETHLTPKEILETVLSPETAADLIEHRRKQRAPLTARAAKGLLKQFSGCRDGPEAAAETMIVNGWKGFKADWLNYGKQTGNSNGNGRGDAPRVVEFIRELRDKAENRDDRGREPVSDHVIETFGR